MGATTIDDEIVV